MYWPILEAMNRSVQARGNHSGVMPSVQPANGVNDPALTRPRLVNRSANGTVRVFAARQTKTN